MAKLCSLGTGFAEEPSNDTAIQRTEATTMLKTNSPVADTPGPGNALPVPTEVAFPFRRLALAALTLLLVGLCVLLAFPFLSAIAWGVALTIVAWPMYRQIRRRVTSPYWSALIATWVVFLVLIVPGLFISYQLINEASSSVQQMKADDFNETMRSRLGKYESLQGALGWVDRANIDLDAELRKLVISYTRNAGSLMQGSLFAIAQFAIALFIIFNFLKDAPSLRANARRLLPMSAEDCQRVFSSAADSVHANIYATVATSLINAVTGGLLFWALGLPSPVLWGVVIFALSVLPILGIFLVWLPASIYLALTNQWGGAALLVAWGIGSAILVDSLLYVRMAGKRMRLHPVPSLLAFLGGLAVFGPSGMILGPAILSVTVAILEVWHEEEVEAAVDAAAAAAADTQPIIERKRANPAA